MKNYISPVGVANRKSFSDLSASCFSIEVRGIEAELVQIQGDIYAT